MVSLKSFLASLFRRRTPRLPHRPQPWWRRLPFPRAFLVTATLLAAACHDAPTAEKATAVCREWGFCDVPAPPPLALAIGCDRSLHAPCTKETLLATAERAAEVIATRPGSQLAVWLIGGSVGETRELVNVASPPQTGKGRGTQAEQARRFVASTRALVLAAAEPALAGAPPHRSPLVESLAKMALADTHGLPRHLVLITDAREVSPDTADFECSKRLLAETDWQRRLDKQHLLAAGSLAGFAITFSHMTASPSGRCPVSVERELSIRHLWESCLKHAGVARVTFTSGEALFLAEPPTSPLARKE